MRTVQLTAWLEILEVLRKDEVALPTLVWNDLKRKELQLVRRFSGFGVSRTPNAMGSNPKCYGIVSNLVHGVVRVKLEVASWVEVALP